MMEVMAELVESAMSANNTFPKIKYKGKFSTSPPNLSTLLKTATNTHIIKRGLRIDQSTPSTLRRYFSLKSFDTSDDMVTQLRLKFVRNAVSDIAEILSDG